MLKIGNLWYLKGDMHLHTNYSDGEQLEAVLAQIVNCGMDFCAVTDHDTFSGSRAACEMLKTAAAPFPILIRGMEATCAACHMLAYGTLKEFDKTGPLAEVCTNIRKNGGYAVAAHPDWNIFRSCFTENGLFQSLVEGDFVDGVELMNFYKPDDPSEIPAEWTNQYYLCKLREGKPFALTVGSDAHRAEDITPDRFVAVFAERCDEAAVLEAIFKKRLSVAVWGEYAFGTPEALELFRQAQKLEKHQKLSCGLKRSRQKDGEILQIEPQPEECYICGDLSVLDNGRFFKEGFAGGNALFLLRDGGNCSAVSVSFQDDVEMRCIPVQKEGRIVPQVDRAAGEHRQGETLLFKGNVNGRPFLKKTAEHRFLLPEHPLTDDGGRNDISIEVYTQDGILLGRKTWDFPIARCGRRYAIENLRSDAPPLDGKEVSGSFCFVQEEGNTVLEMEICDPHFFQPFSGFPMYMGDSIQFGLDFACAASMNDLTEKKIWELGIAMTPAGCELIAYNTPRGHQKSEITQIRYNGCREGDFQRYRLILPPEFTGATFGFNMIYNINDGGGRRGYLGWRNGIGDRKRSADWGYVVLN